MMPSMSFVVRQKTTGRYLQDHSGWTAQREDALSFNSGLSLVNYLESLYPQLPEDSLEVEIVTPSAISMPLALLQEAPAQDAALATH